MKRTRFFITTSLILMAMMLSSCFIPDNYETEVWVHKDGSYEFFYEGQLKYTPAIDKIMKGGLDEDDMEDIWEISDELSESEGFMNVDYTDDGSFTVDVIIARDPGETYDFLSEDIKFFSFDYDEKGNLVISGPELSDDDRENLKSVGIKMKGKLTVKADKGVKVKSHNADKKNKIEKKATAYIWKLDYNSKKPEMIIKL